MCKCVEILQGKLTEKCKGQTFRKPFQSVEVEQAFIFNDDNSMGVRTYSRALITLEGQKKKITTNIMHSHCPFCGEKIATGEN